MNLIFKIMGTIFISFLTIHLSMAQIQMGSTLEGEGNNDVMGYSVSISGDGNRIIIGSRYSSDTSRGGAGRFTGHASVYDWNGSNWIEKGAPIYGERKDDLSGSAVSISSDGNVIAIGAPLNNSNGSDAGQVRVFVWENERWVQRGIALLGTHARDQAGQSLALSADGSLIAIGASRNDAAGTDAGQVRIFQWKNGEWTQLGNTLLGTDAGDRFGVRMGLSSDGHTIAIGGNGNDVASKNAGFAQIYHYNGLDWIQQGQDIYGMTRGGEFGYSITLSADGRTLAVGSPRADHEANSLGYVQVYAWNESTWVQQGPTIYGDDNGDYFGFSIALSDNGKQLAVGAPFNRDDGYLTGQTQIYERLDQDWIQMGETLYGETAVELSGYSVDLSADGSRVIIGASEFIADGSVVGNGKTRIFNLNGLISSVEDFESSIAVRLYPNPTQQYLQIEGIDQAYDIFLFDLNGRLRAIYSNTNQNQFLDLSGLTNGTYLLSIRPKNKGQWISKKITKK